LRLCGSARASASGPAARASPCRVGTVAARWCGHL